ncbi:MAG: AmmeMemoRadiSam system protein B [Chromatiales bacterium]|jgi:AmmeMemoRadiSam system protein B
MTTANIRYPSVAGQFYTADPEELKQQIHQFLDQADRASGSPPKAIIAPHAGYIYSGPVAANAYQLVREQRDVIRRVVILAPAHRYGFYGIAYSSADYFRTPLGDIPVDQQALASVAGLDFVQPLEQAFNGEHALEVHLPFLQSVLQDFEIVPFIVGDASAEQVAQLLEQLWGGDETLIVISSDLSHFHDYETARSLDRRTSDAIEKLDFESIHYEDACGRNPLSGLLLAARRRHLHVETLDLRNSGDTAGSRDSVVGYGAYVVH